MALTDQQKLDEARAAYHQLVTGTMPRVVVDQNGQRVEFTAANRGNLALYIQELEKLVAPVVTPSQGPLGFFF